jgi:hypothetical protein
MRKLGKWRKVEGNEEEMRRQIERIRRKLGGDEKMRRK